MWFKIVYILAAIIIGIGILILITNNIATPKLNTATGSTVITLNGAQIILVGALMFLITYFNQKRMGRNNDPNSV
jgi:hypothetical protein